MAAASDCVAGKYSATGVEVASYYKEWSSAVALEAADCDVEL